MGYRKELDLSATKYPDGWVDKNLIGEPLYTEKMQVFHRWCERVMEYYRMQAFNSIIVEINEMENEKRQAVRDNLRQMMEETFINKGKKIPWDSEELYKRACEKATIPTSINEGFDPEWMDEELKQYGLYTPELALVKKWLNLIVSESIREKVEGMRTDYLEGQMEVVLTNAVELEKDLEKFWEEES